MKRNISEIEQRIILLLKGNSRMTIVDIAKELGISRITAKKTLNSLVSSGIIKNFTISIAGENEDMVLAYTDSMDNIPEDVIIERFSLIDGSYILLLYYEDLPKIKKAKIKRIEVVTSREVNENMVRIENIHCDYCRKEITDHPIELKIRGKTYYVCCPNCERDLKKRGEMAANTD